ncbi:MAG: hypothetical protein WC516_09705 [Patescibacteria group bacterium]|jgi:acyl CoA:acetate/3-ketoacid CoA transferase alpha subunit
MKGRVQGVSRTYYYVFGRINGKSICMGGFSSDNEAQNAANNVKDWDEGDWSVESYRTSQIAVAKSCHKQKLSQSTGLLGESLQPIRARHVEKKKQKDEEEKIY